MATISDKHKFLFVHIPKNAGSSMTTALRNFNGKSVGVFDTHVPCSTLNPFLGEKFSNYFKFAFVRNPWDRMFSLYRFMMKRGRFGIETTIEEFLEKNIITEACKYQTPVVSIIKKPQLDFITDENNNLLVDYVGKFENMNTDFNHICQHIGIKCTLPKVNANPSTKHYREVFNGTTKEIVAVRFAEEIKRFNYEF